MADEKIPLVPPPDYQSAIEHGNAPKGATAPSTGPRPVLPLRLPALDMLRGGRVILASASPRRKQLLAQIGLTNLEIVPSTVPEDLPKSMAPFEYVLATAEQKAENVYRSELDSPKGEPMLVIAADTVVVSTYGEILEKPRNEKEHIAVLKSLRDSGWHKVYTAVVMMSPREDMQHPGYRTQSHVEETAVRFDAAVTDDLIIAYVKTREGADKAGGYGIQGIGSILVERIEGDYNNVVGLPLRSTVQMMEKIMNPVDEEELEEEEE